MVCGIINVQQHFISPFNVYDAHWLIHTEIYNPAPKTELFKIEKSIICICENTYIDLDLFVT